MHSSAAFFLVSATLLFSFVRNPTVAAAAALAVFSVVPCFCRLQMDDCLEIPTYGFAGEQPTFCMVHSGPGMQASSIAPVASGR